MNNTENANAGSLRRLVGLRQRLKTKLAKLTSEIKATQTALRPSPAESGKRGKSPMPKPINGQAITVTLKWEKGRHKGKYVRGKFGDWKREYFVSDKTLAWGTHIPWRRVMSWRKQPNNGGER